VTREETFWTVDYVAERIEAQRPQLGMRSLQETERRYMLAEVLGFVNLFCAGVLAGEEFVICYGVRSPVPGVPFLDSPRPGQPVFRASSVVSTHSFIRCTDSLFGYARPEHLKAAIPVFIRFGWVRHRKVYRGLHQGC
jgi:hypothetical protein